MRTTMMCALLFTVMAVGGCSKSVFAPSCRDESGQVLNVNGTVAAGQTSSHTVVSPKNSNLYIRLSWTQPSAAVALSATIVDCGQHPGCQMMTKTPPPSPGGSSPTPQPWSPGYREMHVDGTRGKTWRIDIQGDPGMDASYSLGVTYRITCES
jgi:hypothetical protein